MQNLREQLLKAGLITEEQAARAAEARRGMRGAKGQPERPRPEEKKAEGKKPEGPKKGPQKSVPNRMLDLSDPRLLRIFQAIEAHRFRDDPRGDHAFHFTLRDGRVRKMMINESVSAALEAGRLAIVESGDVNSHVLVAMAAVADIRSADPEAVRFANG